ncbi:MAG: YHYH protein, partial [Dermatophilaceae bacterium]
MPATSVDRVCRPPSSRPRRAVPALVAALAMLVGACGGGSSAEPEEPVAASSGHDHGDHDHGARPLGDGKVSDRPAAGSVYSCQQRFDPNGPGASDDNPWIDGEWWSPSEKATVDGAVDWPGAEIAVTVHSGQRVVTANGLPTHDTGVFPIAPDDDAYAYDRNPNAIAEQDILLRLPAEPGRAAEPSCVPMGMIGFALSGVAVFNALDVRGRDAPAYEVQDECNGHPEAGGRYHYHDLSGCLPDPDGDAGRHSSLMGYALDGFGLYGPKDDGGVEVRSADLDECHGHVGPVLWDGTVREMYHYHLTRD